MKREPYGFPFFVLDSQSLTISRLCNILKATTDTNVPDAPTDTPKEKGGPRDYRVSLMDDYKPVLHGERLMTDGELAAALRVGPRALRDYRNSGILPYIRLKSNIVYKESDIEKVLTQHYKYLI